MQDGMSPHEGEDGAEVSPEPHSDWRDKLGEPFGVGDSDAAFCSLEPMLERLPFLPVDVAPGFNGELGEDPFRLVLAVVGRQGQQPGQSGSRSRSAALNAGWRSLVMALAWICRIRSRQT